MLLQKPGIQKMLVPPQPLEIEGCFQSLITTDTYDGKLHGYLESPPEFKVPVTHWSHSAPYTPASIYLKLRALAPENT